MRTLSKSLILSLAASLSISCEATEPAKSSACDDAATLIAEQYRRHQTESNNVLIQKTGNSRLYYQALLDRELSDEQIKALRDDQRTSTSVMASLSLAGETRKLLRLIKAGLSANTLSEEGVPIIVIATQCGRADSVDQLIAAGADVHSHDRQNIDAMAAAIIEDSDRIVSLLVARGYKIDNATEPGAVTRRLARSLHKGKYSNLLEAHAPRPEGR